MCNLTIEVYNGEIKRIAKKIEVNVENGVSICLLPPNVKIDAGKVPRKCTGQ
jgi:hypothetical protein